MYLSDVNHPDQNLEQKLQKLYTLSRDKKIHLSFRPPYLNLLKKLGNPHLKLPPLIHVAGTNGKGSTIAILRSILETAGYKVHTYTSPHLIRFNERIVLAGQPIDDEHLENLIDEILNLNAGADLTFFEITTALAFTAFSRTPADICLLEVGMGGRLDCTNVIESPLATIITPIGMDHAEYLGNTLAKIAAEKAGIMKPEAPCIIAQQTQKSIKDGVLNTFKNTAQKIGAPLHMAPVNSNEHNLNLIGEHQQQNLATALTALSMIKHQCPVTAQHIESGLKTIHWPARLQSIPAEKFNLNSSYELYLDGGHNEDAGRIIAQQIQSWKKHSNKQISMIIAMMKGKDTKQYLKPILPLIDHLYLTSIENEPGSQTAKDLKAAAPSGLVTQNYHAALQKIAQNKAPQRILICGSLYLAGHVLKHIEK